MVVCNSTLAGVRDWEVDKVAGQLTFHQLGLVICAICTLIACVVSFFLMFKHVTNYTAPKEQRQILRILLLPPVYTLITLFSYVWHWHAVYFHVVRNCYEVFALASFFTLMCQYIAPELSHQKEYFATMPAKSWPWPASWFNACLKGKLRPPRNGLKWFNIIWFCVFQYCAVRIGTTIIATVTQATGDYCENTLHPAFAHIWMLLFNMLSITFAFYFLLTFYIILHSAIAEHKPFLKFTLLFLCIWLTFWQSTILSFLSASNAIKPNKTLSPGDIAIGFNALGTCFEMMLISILHLVAYSWKPYLPDNAEFAVLEKARKPPMRAIADTLNPLDIIKSFARGMKWMLIGHRRRTEKTEKITASGKENPDIVGQHKVFIAPSSTTNEVDEERTNLVPHQQQHHELDGNIDTLPVPGAFHQHDSYVSQDSLPLHPTPAEQIPIPQHDDQEFGIAETRYEGYRPPPVSLPVPQQQTSSSSPLPQQNLSRPLSVSTPPHPHLSPSQKPQLTPTSPGSPDRLSPNRQSQSPLPYPDPEELHLIRYVSGLQHCGPAATTLPAAAAANTVP
ncbi:DUF300-domain-containing protein [Ascodesmis nigricans]|uniref:DUF300-domain-containing protein n=1 Tax=Ascodesmis nigricans TaxID=341454 RepID=A0A4V3SI19_9PEZI|nr:DUF300-domain-containing protein [Ascodesmis nigricans]